MPLKLTQENFEQEVLKSDVPVMVDFWAEWCGPCRMLGPVLDKLDEKASGYKIGKVNVDEQQALAGQYQIMSIPSVLIFVNGQVVDQNVGFANEAKLKQMIEKHI